MKNPRRILHLAALAGCAMLLCAHAGSHWAFEPLQTAQPPAVKDTAWPKTDTDRFLLASMEKQGLRPSAAADRRTLLRRATYDLTGLPPTPAELDAFLSDTSMAAWEKVVDRLLASSAYGEKWGREWLDVVRYADTAGENTDRPLPHAWRYRNWVIDAFNKDLPYDEFVREQIAGDLLAAQSPPESAPAKIVATGFLAIARRFGHDIDKDMHLTCEDTIDTMGKSLLGLSLGCARCHDHKYDPVSQRDYYGLYGIFQSTRFPFTGCEARPLPKDMVSLPTPESAARLNAWNEHRAPLERAVQEAEEALAGFRKNFESSKPVKVASGLLDPGKSQDLALDGQPVTLAISRGEMLQLSILPRGNYGADSTGVEWEIAESAGAHRTWSLASDFLADPSGRGGMQHADQYGHEGVWHLMDLVPSPHLLAEFVANAENTKGLMVWRGSDPCPSMFINTKNDIAKFLTITMPARSVGLHPGPNGGVAVAWESQVDGPVTVRGKISEIDPGGDGVEWLLERRPSIAAPLTNQKQQILALTAAKKALKESSDARPSMDLAYAVAEAPASNARIQKKGEPKDPGPEVPRKVLDLFGGAAIPPSAGSGRLQLADWLTHGEARFLAARVMVNRIWQGHFCTGIVATANDFGTRGSPPSDPALLDYLAAQFIEGGWSVKALHRRLLLSAAYARSSSNEPGVSGFQRRRLTAEELRDTLLMVSGTLDRAPGGAHPFPPESGWKYTQHDPFAAVYDSNKRSVYLMVQRTRRHPFLALFDGADPNASTPVRGQSTVPTQALYFLNDPFVHRQAKTMAQHVIAAASSDADRLDLATRLLYGRTATDDERAVMQSFLTGTSATTPSLTEPERSIEIWSAWLRVLFGTSELLYLD
jgi:hypothetical protein